MTETSTSSTSSVLSSLALYGAIFGVFLTGFLLLRIKFKRIYQPKSSFDLVVAEEKPEPLPPGLFYWVIKLIKKPDSFIIQQSGLDGYFFIRYIGLISAITGVGCLMLIILLPVNATNGNGDSGFDQLAISNVKHPKRFYAHALLSWFYYGFLIYVIYRELVFYNSLRLAVLSSPKYAKKQSSKTVLFQTVSSQYYNINEFYKLFDGVKRVWAAKGPKELAGKVAMRDQIAYQLERAITKVLRKAVKVQKKASKKGRSIEPADDLDAYVPYKKRPTFRKTIPIFGKKLNTIDFCKEKLPELNKEVENLQKDYADARPMNSIFVEFESQYAAQLAVQSCPYHVPFHFLPAYVGIEPADIIWPNMRLFWWERLIRSSLALAAVLALIILWAFPVAFIGLVSNVQYLIEKLSWLDWINNLPSQLLGIITSIFPTVVLSFFMGLLPPFMRLMAKIAGAPSVQDVEYKTQQSYFIFQAIQVFLVTALASSATSAVEEIIDKPSNAMKLLASDLPKSSNFYISYIILQGLAVSAGALFQIDTLCLFYILGHILDNTIRKKYERFTGISMYGWGTVFPIYTNLTIVILTYSVISPLILPFATVGFALLYIAFLHNTTYVFGQTPDARGQHYPRALFQTFVGIYLGEVCLLGIFIVGKGWGPIVIEAILICFTVYCHITINNAFDRLLKVVPADVMKPLDGYSETPSCTAATPEMRNAHLKAEFKATASHAFVSSTDSSEAGDSRNSQESQMFKEDKQEQNITTFNYVTNKQETNPEVPLLADGDEFLIPDAIIKKNHFVSRFFAPHIYLSYHVAKRMLPASYYEEPDALDPETEKHAYDYPDVTAQAPVLWIPRDPMGFSTKFIKEFKDIIHISDEGADFDEKGRMRWLGDAPPAYTEDSNGESGSSDSGKESYGKEDTGKDEYDSMEKK
ncbi:hypothetical protein PACTADRAFT_48637 [Pachysolen tannophilus NRRL Y-2460]|uniref:DUF221-domain-containing protein n=1 Tax=Pachysolen tannophilus NRRL Y-2460 TaxID=669874 RepID=A0A1E4TYK6_PACTA|nr:hypothetical protein PACTADRAFT_48637 [Pachysolen tannophilus NRRL Y-2460]